MRIIKCFLAGMLLMPALMQAQVPAADNATGSANINMNWFMTTGFDPTGNILLQTKQFFDNNGQVIQAQSKVFYRSNPSTVYTHVMASQTIKDAEGRNVLSTLVAPIDYADFNYMSNFVLATDGSNYSFKNFDRYNPSGTETDLTNAPQTVGGQATKGTLGWYYGINNTWEPYTPTTNFPYSRSSIYKDGTNTDKRAAEAGEVFVMGSNHETSGFVTPVSGELGNYVQVRNRFFSTSQIGALPATLQNFATQTVERDANGKESITIRDKDGYILITASPGTDMTFTNTVGVAAPPTINYTQVVSCVPGTNFSVQTLTAGNNMYAYLLSNTGALTLVYAGSAGGFPINTTISGTGTLIVLSDVGFNIIYTSSGTQYSANSSANTGASAPTIGYFKILADNTPVTITGSYTLYDMGTEASTSLSGGQLNRGYYKLVANSGVANATYTNGFTDVSYSFYNGLHQMVAGIPPNGVKLLEGTGYLNYATLATIPFVNMYNFDSQGRLISSGNPDGGSSVTVYRTDGKIRFVQNALQAASGSYGYTNYDQYGRSIESGQYDGTGTPFATASSSPSIIESIDPVTGGLGTGTKTDVLQTIFDAADNTHGQSGYTQDFSNLGGRISTSKRYSTVVNNAPSATNLVSQTWYNYDEEGKIVWSIKYIASLGSTVGYKTTDYTYDAMNRLIKRVFQKNNSAETFVHYYQYDPANGRLWYVYTNTVDNPATETLQAKYIYYLTGGLKRVELATNLQGIDYTYTLAGGIKAINNSNASADPGGDAVASNGFSPDVFGEVLDYYPNDYNNARTVGANIKGVNTSSIVPVESYNGNIKAMTWFSLKPVGLGSTAPITYVYNYDPKYQFIGSTWGNTLNFATAPASFTTTAFNKETVTLPGSGTPGTAAYDLNGNILNLQRTDASGNPSDVLAYSYTPNTDKLATVTNTGASPFTMTYGYDQIGRETSETSGVQATTKYMKYDAMGNVTLVSTVSNFSLPLASYVYDEAGNRIEKISYNSSNVPILATYYYGDAIYVQTITGGTTYGTLTPVEYLVSGASSRIGTYFRSSNLYTYELKDHLGDIRAVVAKTGAIQGATDYYPFGMAIATLGTPYRFGYAGDFAEADGETGWNSFELRMYNPRIARWMTTDPKGQFASPYVGIGNDPVDGVDPDGGLMIFVNGFRLHPYFKSITQNGGLIPISPHPKLGDPERIYQATDVMPLSTETAKAYWDGVDDEFMTAFNDHNAVYADGTNTPLSKASQRYNEGIQAALQLVNDIDAGKITLAPDETIKLVGHSHGGAYAAGMEYELNLLYQQGLFNHKVEYIGVIAPAQPQQFGVLPGIASEQWSRRNDLVTAKGLLPKILGSKFAKVKNIQDFHIVPNTNKGLGHYIFTFHNLKGPLKASITVLPLVNDGMGDTEPTDWCNEDDE